VLELNSALNSASNDAIFDQGHRAKTFHPHYSIHPSMALCPRPHRNFFPDNPSKK
jgi:hypothetical protein